MGCAVSKIDNEDVVRRCKERRRLMKEAVYARHHLAGAHADYCRSLRLTGSALSTFAANEPLSVSDNTPAVFLHPNKSEREHYAHSPFPKRGSHDTSHPPPPPFSPSPCSASTATTPPKLPHSLSAASTPHVNPTRRRARPKPAMKLPHILSESSPNLSPRSMRSNLTNPNTNTNPNFNFYPTAYSTYSSTPSQASSVWNWENFYPPSPPDSEYFNQKEMMMKNDKRRDLYHGNPSGSDFDEDDNETSASEYDFFHKKPPKGSFETKSQMENSSLKYGEGRTSLDGGGETEREEVQCSEWGDHDHDHYSSSSSSSGGNSEDEENDIHVEGLEEEDGEVRSEIGTRLNYGSVIGGSVGGESVKVGLKPGFGKLEEKAEDEAESSTAMSYGNASHVETDMLKMVVRHNDLKEIVDAIKENFEMAAKAGDQVSEMLEIGRAQLDRSFRRLKKTVYHSSSVLSNLSSTWTSKPPLAVKYRLDAASLNDQGGPKSLCSTLDRLLAWEKKLYEEVKAREGVKIAHEKKLSVLQSQEYKGEDETKIDKTKASIKKLQSLIIVTSQAVSTTSTAILGLRDSDLVPQLIELCHGFMYMWRSLHEYHEIQSNIVQQVRGLVNRATKGESTSELHRQATRDLESAVSAWHSSFCRLIKFHRDFICSVHGWFKLSFLPVDIDNDNTVGNRETSDVYAFCDEWKLALDRVPDTVASEAIKSFINVVHVISVKQTEELKIKKRTEAASKDLERKASSLRNIEKKYYHSYSMVGLGLPDSGPDNGQVLDARDPLAEKKVELASCQRRVEDEMLRHSKAVEVTRAMTLNNLQTGLPGVFQALTSFSSLFMEALETVCTRSYAIK